MGVLKETPPIHFETGKEKHVVAKGRRPIRHGEANAFARDHAAAANQEKGRDRAKPGEAVEPGYRFWDGHFR